MQAPDDTATGVVPVVVTTSTGTATSTVALFPYSPAFDLLDARHVAAIILRSDGSGYFGMAPTTSWARMAIALAIARSVPMRATWSSFSASDSGRPTPPPSPEKCFPAPRRSLNRSYSTLTTWSSTPLFVGLAGAGLYQINLIVPPGLGAGDVPIQAWVGQ